MKKRLSIALLIILILCMGIPVSARAPRNGKYIDRQGHVYIMRHGKPRTGYFHYKGRLYYGHRTSSSSYPKGSCTTDALRMRNGKLYYFGHDGKKQTKSSRYLQLNRHSTSVRYLVTGRMTRYNVKHRRYQWLNPNTGRWEDVGMECMPYGAMDLQR